MKDRCILPFDSIILSIPEKSIEYSDFIIRIDKDGFFIYDQIVGKAYSFDLDGIITSTTPVHRYNDRGNPLSGASFSKTGNSLFFLKTHRFYYFMDSLQNSGIISTSFNQLPIARKWGSDPAFQVSVSDNLLIVGVSSCPVDLLDGNQKWLDARFYKSPGLFAIYDIRSILNSKNQPSPFQDSIAISNLIGARSDVYKKERYLPHLDNLFWYYDCNKKLIIYSEETSHQIRVLDLMGKTVAEFGEKGKFIENEKIITLSQLNGSRPEISRQMESARILGPSYLKIFHDHQYLYRIYKAPVKQTLVISEKQFESFQGRQDLDKTREQYLQIYNVSGKYKCVADFQIPSSLEIINIVDGTIYSKPIVDKETRTLKILLYITSIQ
ncbi:MAG: hypothetical protein K0B15_17070 [Lentimicrobium sp.]|nr:hypothetical protein [Lentimicrobium sp.]